MAENTHSPAVYTTTAEGLRFYEETAQKYVRDGRRRFWQALFIALALLGALGAAFDHAGPKALWLIALFLIPILWAVSSVGQWIDGRQYLVKIAAQRHYRERDMAEAAQMAPTTTAPPPQPERAPAVPIEAEDDGKLS